MNERHLAASSGKEMRRVRPSTQQANSRAKTTYQVLAAAARNDSGKGQVQPNLIDEAFLSVSKANLFERKLPTMQSKMQISSKRSAQCQADELNDQKPSQKRPWTTVYDKGLSAGDKIIPRETSEDAQANKSQDHHIHVSQTGLKFPSQSHLTTVM